MNRTFRRGSGCFKCKSCGKQTRDVNGQNGQLGLCPLCQAKSECGNMLSDSGRYTAGDCWDVFEKCETVEECDRLLNTLLGE